MSMLYEAVCEELKARVACPQLIFGSFECALSYGTLMAGIAGIDIIGGAVWDVDTRNIPTAVSPPVGTFFGIPNQNATYDYVIVGGGTSGLTVASRLAEAGHTVGVAEAGTFYEISNGNLSQIPAYATRGSRGAVTDIQPTVDWGFVTTPQAGLDGRRVHYAQGKTLGGSSARNVLAYQRGTVDSYQLWADAVQDESFTFERLLPFFQKSPEFTPPDTAKQPPGTSISYDPKAFSPKGGPLHVSFSNYRPPFTPYIRRGFQALGLKSIAGFASGELLGYAEMPSTIDPSNEHRSSSETSFLRRAIARQHPLTVYPSTSAKRILFDASKRATGVTVDTTGTPYTLSANKEVIVAAGVFKSPQLLMVSGVGPPATLQSFGIPVVSALDGVGQNIEDQPYYGLVFRTHVPTLQALADPAVLDQANQDFVRAQTGPLTNTGNDLVGWTKLPDPYRANLSASARAALARFPDDWPELELLPVTAAILPVNDTANYFSVTIANVAPLSRGNVTITSPDTADPPQIDPNWLTADADAQLAVQSVRLARDLAGATGLVVGDEVHPGPAVQTDAEILAFVRRTAYTIHHAVSSCKMGPKGVRDAVVDTSGRVYGVSALRVLDASTFALLPPGHCQATVYALVEKFAADILSEMHSA